MASHQDYHANTFMGFHIIEGKEWDANTTLLDGGRRWPAHPVVLLVGTLGIASMIGFGWQALSNGPQGSSQAQREHTSLERRTPVEPSTVPLQALRALPQQPSVPTPLPVSEDQLIESLVATAQTPPAIAITANQSAPVAQPAAPKTAAPQPPVSVLNTQPAAKTEPIKQAAAPVTVPKVGLAQKGSAPTPAPKTEPTKQVSAPVTKQVEVATRPVAIVKPAQKPAPKTAANAPSQGASNDPCAAPHIMNAHGVTPISTSGLRQITNGVATFHGGCRLTAGSRIGGRIVTEIDASTLTIKTTGGPINFYDDGA